MRILHMIGTLDPRQGGPAEAVRQLLLYAPGEFAGEVVTADDPAAAFLQRLPFLVHALGPPPSAYERVPGLIPWLRANGGRFDAVVVHGLWRYSGCAAWRVFAGRKRYVVFPHGALDPYFKRRFPLKQAKKWLYWLAVERWVLRRAAAVLFTCHEEMRLAAESIFPHRWAGEVVPFGVAPPPAEPDAARAAFYRLCPQARGRRFLLFLGRIDRKKGCDLLIHAFARVADAEPGLDLVMAGPDAGGWRADLESIASKAGAGSRVHWPGMLSGEAKWGAFRACEAFVLPSHQENFGMAVAEALSCGRPVLLSDKVNIARDVAAAGAGWIDEDTAAGTERLLRRWIAAPPAERQAMEEQALACYRRNYDMVVNAGTILRMCAGKASDEAGS